MKPSPARQVRTENPTSNGRPDGYDWVADGRAGEIGGTNSSQSHRDGRCGATLVPRRPDRWASLSYWRQFAPKCAILRPLNVRLVEAVLPGARRARRSTHGPAANSF